MNRANSIFFAILVTFAIPGCQVDAEQGGTVTVNVADQLSGDTSYTIDLIREDAIYFLAPNVDASRLSVTCPSRSTMSFDEYVANRVQPTGVKYDPANDILALANSRVPRESVNQALEAAYAT